MLRIALIGSTGSIGRQVLSVVDRYPEKFSISALVAGSNRKQLNEQTAKYRPDFAGLASGGEDALDGAKTTLCGDEILAHAFDGCDVALIAAGGFAGLAYTLRAAELKKKIALANKESLVCGGELVVKATEGLDLIPVDSEHSAIFQALGGRRDAPFDKLVLTASGGPFFRFSDERLKGVTAEDALRHPTWNMGEKITVDCATLLNKGYEVIEAKWLYGAEFSQIEAVVHPESIIHSLVYFSDGAALAQLGYPTMEVPIQLALTYPERLPCAPRLDLAEIGALHFYPLPTERFPCYKLAVEAGKEGGTLPTVLNAAGEIAVYAFLKGGISFTGIADTVEETLSRIPRQKAESFDQLKEVDALSRRIAADFVYGK